MSTQVFGWAPVAGKDHINISFSSTSGPPSLITTFQMQPLTSSTDSTHEYSPPPESPSPASSNSSLPIDSSSSTLKSTRNHTIPRPRNPFIIFRCEYSDIHTIKGGKRVRRPPGTVSTEKTLSKRAAEAWHLLSAQEKNRFRILADREKEEHARLHPNYRFRPSKKKMVQKKKLTPLLKSKPTSPPSAETPAIAHSPQVFPSAPPPSSPPPPPPVDVASVKAGRRRSASVPSLFFGGIPSVPQVWTVQSPKPEMKRSQSAMGNRPPSIDISTPFTYYDYTQSVDPRSPKITPLEYFAPEEAFGTVLDASQDSFLFPSHYASPIPIAHPSSSSLASWNGEVGTPVSASPREWSTSPQVEAPVPQPLQTPYLRYNASSSDISVSEAMARYSQPDPVWAPAATNYTNVSLGLETSGALFSPVAIYNDPSIASTSYIPGEYVGSEQSGIELSQEAMLALNIDDSSEASQFDFNDYVQSTFISQDDVLSTSS